MDGDLLLFNIEEIVSNDINKLIDKGRRFSLKIVTEDNVEQFDDLKAYLNDD